MTTKQTQHLLSYLGYDVGGVDGISGPKTKDGIRIIPEVITVTTEFAAGELGWWGDVLYRSKVDDNIYNPSVYPDNWEKVEM